jgi:hypothetical protein
MAVYRTVSPAGMEAYVTSAIDEALAKKRAKNMTGVTILANKLTAWLDTGKIALASATTHSLNDIAGFAEQDILTGTYGRLIKIGNIPGLLIGKGATPGQPVYLSDTPGEVTLTLPTGDYIQVGDMIGETI